MRPILLMLVVACSQSKPAPSNEATGSAQVAAPVTTEAAAFERARAEHKGVSLEFYAEWATPSAQLAKAMRDPSVAAPLAGSFVPLRIDVTDGSDAALALQERYAAKTMPALVFVATDGTVLGRVTEALDPPRLVEAVQAAAARIKR